MTPERLNELEAQVKELETRIHYAPFVQLNASPSMAGVQTRRINQIAPPKECANIANELIAEVRRLRAAVVTAFDNCGIPAGCEGKDCTECRSRILSKLLGTDPAKITLDI